MRASHWFSATLKETPSDAEIISHQLMLRAGLIRKLGSGLYTWLPTGLKVLRRIEAIVREEMNAAGALEILMPSIQPAELWKETGRWDTFGGQLLTMHDSNDRDYCYGPTHEEVITDLVRCELRSYKQVPINFYQIQTKFRDEIRPRFGVMRAREFIMKDAYSFHLTKESLNETYEAMYSAYTRIFKRLNLRFRAVEADTGAIGGSASHEFQVLADTGEDLIFYSDTSSYAANVEQATSLIPAIETPDTHAMREVQTPDQKTIEEVAAFLRIRPEETVKTLIVEGTEHPLVALILKGSDSLNPLKAEKHPLVKSPLRMADEQCIKDTLRAPIGSLGPVNLDIPVIVCHHARAMASMVCGANREGWHYQHAVWDRDAACTDVWDLRQVQVGDKSPDGEGSLLACRGIEVGHIFQLGDKYAKAMQANVLNETGQLQTLQMGCYGIGISRLVAASIEQHHDARGIIWPDSIAPFQVVIVPINAHRQESVRKAAEKLYSVLTDAGFDVLLDDRNERPGVLFTDNELLGIPHRLTVSERLLQQQSVEYQARTQETGYTMPIDEILLYLQRILSI